jgi:hypothetical protein
MIPLTKKTKVGRSGGILEIGLWPAIELLGAIRSQIMVSRYYGWNPPPSSRGGGFMGTSRHKCGPLQAKPKHMVIGKAVTMKGICGQKSLGFVEFYFVWYKVKWAAMN